MNSFMKTVKDIIIPSITVLTGILVVLLNYSVSEVESRLKENQEKRAERESVQQFDLKIYDKVVKSLESGNQQKQRVAQALVVVMASDSFRVKLLNVLEKTAADTVRKAVARIIEKENRFRAEEESRQPLAAATSEVSDWKSYSYDVFWCEESGPKAHVLADTLAARLRANKVIGRVRTRQLPESVNARYGYQIAGFVIRANKGEFQVAEQLQAMFGDDFRIASSRQPTPSYISAFVCPAQL